MLSNVNDYKFMKKIIPWNSAQHFWACIIEMRLLFLFHKDELFDDWVEVLNGSVAGLKDKMLTADGIFKNGLCTFSSSSSACGCV